MLDWAIILFSIFLLGFFIGKYFGKNQGLKEGQAMMPLLLRQESLALGYCLLCASAQSADPGMITLDNSSRKTELAI